MKKLFAVLLAVVMVLSLSLSAFAADPTDGTIVVADSPEGVEYFAYKIFDATKESDKMVYKISDASPWFNILFTTDTDGNIVGNDDAIKFKVTGEGTPYTVVADEGYSAAKFAEWIMTEVTDWPTVDVYSSTVNADGIVEISQNGAALPMGYYLIAQANPATGSTDFSYTDTTKTDPADTANWVSEKAFGLLSDEQKETYDKYENGCYYETGDADHEIPVTPDVYEILGPDGYTQGSYYVLKAKIDAETYNDLGATDQAKYTPDAANFAIKAAAKEELDATAYENTVTDPKQQALYESFSVHYKSGSTTDYVPSAAYDAMSDAQKAQYEATAGLAYKTKDTITGAQYAALGQSTDDDVRALQDNYTGVVAAVAAPDSSKTAALATVYDDRATQIQNKNDMPLDKDVEKDGTDDYDDDGTAVKVGDTLKYKITTKIPTDYKDGVYDYEFLVTDKMSDGLTFNKDITILIGNEDEDDATIVIKLNDTDPMVEVKKNDATVPTDNEQKLIEAIGGAFELVTTDKTLSGNAVRYGAEDETMGGNYSFELSINTASQALRQYGGEYMYILYTANVNENAKGELVQNTAVLEYTDEHGLHEKDAETDNYIARIVVDKFETGNRSMKLPGAEFVLYKLYDANDPDFAGKTEEDDYGEPTKLFYHIDDSQTVTWVDEANASKATTDANGFAEFLYLEDGTYYLRETKAPVDYTRLLNDIEIVVDGSDAVDNRLTQAQREQILSPVANVANTPGTSMPSTGGVGATLLTIGGVALMLAAGAFLVLRRRKEQE